MADWQYHFYDRASRDLIDTLPVEGVSFGQKLSGAGQFRGRVPVGRDGIPPRRVRDATMPMRTMLFVQRDNALVWGGIVTMPRNRPLGSGVAEITASEIITLADGWFIDTQTWTMDQVDIARGLVEGRDPWLDLAPHPGPSGLVMTKQWSRWDFVPVAQTLGELTEQTGGLEYSQQAGWGDEGRPHIWLRVGAPKLGARAAASGIVLEYNADTPEVSNVMSGTLGEGAGLAVRTWVSAQSSEGVPQAAMSQRLDLRDQGYPMIERHESLDRISSIPQLQAHADALQQAASAPTLTAQFEVAATEGLELGHWEIGDDIRVRVTDPWWPSIDDAPGLDTWMRLVEYTVTPGTAAQVEKYEFTVADMAGWW